MIDHLNAMKALIEASGFTVYLISATETQETPVGYPYVLISPAYGRPGELPLSGGLDSLDEDLQVRSVGSSVASMLGLLRDVRSILSPGKQPGRLVVSGYRATVTFVRHELSAPDRDITITGSSSHPIYGVDTFRLLSAPSTN